MMVNINYMMKTALKKGVFDLHEVDLLLKRRSTGSYTNGKWIDTVYTDMWIRAIVENASPEDLMDLPENRRTEESITIFSRSQLFNANLISKIQPDRVVWNSKVYEVHKVIDWDEQGGYFKSIAVKVGQ